MNIKEKAKLYAIEAHTGQVRKADPRKPMIIHPINVANILESFGFDDNVVAAGYLHDVVEDTEHTMEDIEKNFGKDITSLVTGDNEPDKNWTWEERKKYTIETIKNLDLRHKAIVCADKISNLEDTMIDFGIKGKVDFSLFKRGFEQQKWYFTSIYESLIYNEDENHPMFKKLKEIIDYVFYNQEEKNNSNLQKIHFKFEELKKLKSFVETTPFVIEFTGLNQRKIIMNKINEVATNSKMKVEIINQTKENKTNEISKIIEEMIIKNPDIILIDQIDINKFINLEKLFKRKDISEEEYNKYKKHHLSIIKEKIALIISVYKDEIIILNKNKIKKDKQIFKKISLKEKNEDISLEIIEYIIDNIREEYLDRVNDKKELIKKKSY